MLLINVSKELLNYNIDNNKIVYINKIYKNNLNIFIINLNKIKVLYKKTYKLNTFDFLLREEIPINKLLNKLLLSIINYQKKQSLYFLQKIKKQTKNYIFLLDSLYNETCYINKQNEKQIKFDFSILETYIKTEKFEDFWINILETITSFFF